MYTQAMDIPGGPKAVAAATPEEAARNNAFDARIAADLKIEPRGLV